jgi:ABC-2 type transport system ATP-binding protein
MILCKHQMNQIEALCDQVLMIHGGQEVFYGDLNDIKARFRKRTIQVAVEGNELGDLPGVVETRFHKGSFELILAPDITPQTLLDHLRERDLTVNRFEITTPSLNEIFLKIVREGHG